jgi:Antibiotic biosynthesis monooxygenase
VIVRVVTAIVPNERMGAFNDLLRRQLPILKAQPGLVYVKLARRIEGQVEEVMLFEQWRDAASLYGWVGPSLDRPRLLAGAEEMADRIEVRHYESLDVEPDGSSIDPWQRQTEPVHEGSPGL